MNRHAFSLMELLVVITIIAILAAMLVPAIGLVREAAKQVNCISNQRQMLLAIHAYAENNEGLTPPAEGASMVPNLPGPRSCYGRLMYQDYLGSECVVAWPAGPVINAPAMRWPNVVSCPIFRPPSNPTVMGGSNTAYTVRWNLGTLVGNGELFPVGMGGSAVLGTLHSTIPFIIDTQVLTNPVQSGGYWEPTATVNNVAVRLGHARNRAVAAYSDGHAAACDRATLRSQGVLNGVIWNVP